MKPSVIITAAVLYLTTIILLAHLLAPEEYNWIRHSVSGLAAQHYEHGWVMQTGFFGFGVLITIALALRLWRARSVSFPELFLFFYGVGMLLSGYFSTYPFLAGVPHSVSEGLAHTMVATIAGFFFTASILAAMLTEHNTKTRKIHFVFLLLVLLISLFFGLAVHEYIDVGKGIFQRLLYLISFSWLILYFPQRHESAQ